MERVQTLSDFLFVRTGFAGNRDNYGDPRNSFLNDVLERRLGIPITLSVIYLEVGRRAGLNLFGVSFPSHFLVKAVDERVDVGGHGCNPARRLRPSTRYRSRDMESDERPHGEALQ